MNIIRSWENVLLLFFFSISLGIPSLCFSQSGSSTITFTTYYPIPYGAYRRLRITPTDSIDPLASCSHKGEIYFDDSDSTFYSCSGTNWIALGGSGGGGLWVEQDDDIYSTNTGNVGIGTDTPNAAFQVIGAISRQGTTVTDSTQVNLGVDSQTGNIYSTVGGGHENIATGQYSTVGGGAGNNANAQYSTVGGGRDNLSSGDYSTICGGEENTAQGNYSFVGAGLNNTAGGLYSTLSGGENNTASSDYSTISGGHGNTASADYSTVTGGRSNTASGQDSIVSGGGEHIAAGEDSWAGGRKANAGHKGAFVWADSSDAVRASNGNNTFSIYASGGVYFNGGDVGWADISEFMGIAEHENVGEGELVSLVGKDLLGRTKTAYDSKLVGVISGEMTSTFHLGSAQSLKEGVANFPVALTGRCFVKVCNESGLIYIGDAITSSSSPGLGMKADKSCKIIGYAMEESNFQSKGMDNILVFVNVGYYVSEDDFKRLKEIEKLKEEIELLKITLKK